MFDDPELVFAVVDEGDGGFGSGGDGEVCALEIEGVVVVDAALLAEGKVQVEQARRGTGRRRWVRAARESSQTVRGMRPVLRWRVRFCRWSSI